MYTLNLVNCESAPIPVVSIGNITVGGSGKTPVVEKLADLLKNAGFRPGIITRGYKRNRKGTFCIDAKNDTADNVGDEPLMLAQRTLCPVVVGVNRIAAIEKGVEEHGIDVAILDDGFQLKNIRKDVEVLVLDGTMLKKNNNLFPLGPNREPMERVNDADIVLLNKGEPNAEVFELIENKPVYRMHYSPLYLYNVKYRRMGHYNILKGKRVLAFAGLGDNESFFKLLRTLEAQVVYEVEYPDHHAYSQKDIDELASYTDVACKVTTEKDAVKLIRFNVPDNFFALSIEASIERENDFFESILYRIKEGLCQRESTYSTQH